MTEDRDFKRLIRARMEKTGEAYTTARAHLLDKRREPAAPPPPLLPPDHEALAGASESTLQSATGHGWAHWLTLLDAHGSRELPHGAIARHLQDDHGLGSWWAQTVTVGYERLRGLRAPGQKRDGSWEIGRSRTLPVPAERLFDAFHDASERERWLEVEGVTLRSARPGTVVRLLWADGSVAEATFTAKSETRTTVTVQHRKLPDGGAAEAMKQAWTQRLDRLGAWLGEEP